jgi:tRNA threonylcarbamoyladenosine biosynthesis protein TsaE
MTPIITTRSAHETEQVGAALGTQLRPGDLVVLSGDLGAGKTVFVKGVARALGVVDPVTSPTFTIVQEYDGTLPLVHVDVYRLERMQELHDLGFEELLDGNVVVVEWGDAIAHALPADRLEVCLALDEADDDVRRIEITSHGTRWATRQSALEAVLESRAT